MEDDQPVFAAVSHFITTTTKEYFFVLKFLKTVGYCYHYHAYKVVPDVNEIGVCIQADLKDYNPLTVIKTFDHTMSSDSLVQLKYHVF